MDPRSPKKFIVTKYCFFMLGDDTSFFFFPSLFVSFVKTVTSLSSAPQVTFRQATRSVSNENGLCQARHMAHVEANLLVHASLPCLVK